MEPDIYITDHLWNGHKTLLKLIKEPEGYIFRHCNNPILGHTGFSPTIQLALERAFVLSGTKISTTEEINNAELYHERPI
jgi:hypothetical protein